MTPDFTSKISSIDITKKETLIALTFMDWHKPEVCDAMKAIALIMFAEVHYN